MIALTFAGFVGAYLTGLVLIVAVGLDGIRWILRRLTRRSSR